MTALDLDRLAGSLLAFLLDSAIRATVVTAVVGAAIFLLRGRGAALQLKAWTVVLWAALALPAMSALVPAWQWTIPTLPLLEARSSSADAAVFAVSADATTAVSGTPDRMSNLLVAGSIYAAGVLLLLLHAGFAWRTTRRLRSSARPVLDPDVRATLHRHASATGLRASPLLMESPAVVVPLTMSVVRPVVLLPDDWREWPADRLDAVLIHELAHVARRDALTQRVTLFNRAVFWFSPLSWWLHRRIAQLAEQASDEAALHAGVPPVSYAETLLDCFAKLQRQPRRAEWHVAMARRADTDAARRMERILTWKGGQIVMRPKLWFIALAVVALSITGVTASVRLSSVTAEPPALPALTSPQPQPVTLAPPPAMVALQSSRPVQPAPKPRVQPTPATNPAPQPEPQQSTPPVVQESPEEFAKGAYASSTPGLVVPKVLRDIKPRYTSEAMRAKIQGMVGVELIVLADGTVGKARVIESLDPFLGLDNEAVKAVKGWTFMPGTLNGEAVPVLVKINMEFRLH